jgi:serine/threonine protein kinase
MKNLNIESMQRTGTRLNQYILTEEIGRGGHGIVYRAYHEDNISEQVAVKIIEDSGNLDSLLVEPELLSKLDHPNIIKLHDFFIYGGKLILVTEYIEGVTLQFYLEKQGRLTELQVKTFLSQMASALAHAHANNVIHRDIKPSNILVSDKDQNLRFVLVDFGISRISGGIQTAKRVAGTYYYMAPEQLRGRPCEQSDLWALGTCSYLLLTGIKPFEGNTEEDLSRKIQFSIPQSPGKIIKEIDPELENIVFRLLEKQLINRTASAIELLEELKCFSELESSKPISKEVVRQVSSSASTWETQKSKEIRESWIRFWIFTFLSTVPSGVIGEAVSISGLLLFYVGQEKRDVFRTGGGISLLIVGFFISFIFSSIVYAIIFAASGQDEAVANNITSSINVATLFISLPFILVGVHYLTKVRSLQEDLILYKTLREASESRETIINLLKNFVDRNWGNINLRQKHIELLLLDGQLENAVVESKLLLEVDPYDFGANLLLANSYLEIGLYEECVQVCNSYLALSGHSFEFSDLKNQCLKIMEEGA